MSYEIGDPVIITDEYPEIEWRGRPGRVIDFWPSPEAYSQVDIAIDRPDLDNWIIMNLNEIRPALDGEYVEVFNGN